MQTKNIQIYLSVVLIFTSLFVLGQTKSKDSIIIKTTEYKMSLRRTAEAEEKGIYGKITIVFDIDSSCSISNMKIKQGIGYGCDELVIKEIKKLYDQAKRNPGKCVPKLNSELSMTFESTDVD